MTISAGSEVYDADAPPVKARGTAMSASDLDAALSEGIQEILQDISGTSDIANSLLSLAATSFEVDTVTRILYAPSILENWRVGEAIAEAYLTDHSKCDFPWPTGRDLKNPNASPAGADLVGFQLMEDDANWRFAFGEVKTSKQEKWPPSAMEGPHGLKKQIEVLRDDETTKHHLVKYLGHHSINSTWFHKYEQATSLYLKDPTDVSLFGLLIRDVEPKPQDLRNRAKALSSGCHEPTSIELMAIYLPANSIDSLSERATLAQGGTQ